MILTGAKSLCEKRQKIIVSRDEREDRQHRAINPKGRFEVRQYRLDGELVKNITCCDFLLLNDTSKMAYLIELKGKKLKKAVEQLVAGEQLVAKELQGYTMHFRIVCSRVHTHRVHGSDARKFQKEYQKYHLKIKETQMEENLC